jgi:triacylglycerol lipase
MDVIKCEHERAVLLFVDSLMNNEYTSLAYQCTDPERFKKGICLSCRKNRCNNIGYNTKKMRKRSNCKMYLKTRAVTPFRGELGIILIGGGRNMLFFTFSHLAIFPQGEWD